MKIVYYVFLLFLTTCSVFAKEASSIEIVSECDCYRWKFGGRRLYKELTDKLFEMGRYGVGRRLAIDVPQGERYWEKYEIEDAHIKRYMFSSPYSFSQIFQNCVVLHDLIKLSHDCKMEGLRHGNKNYKQALFEERLSSETDLTMKAYQIHKEYENMIVNEFTKMKHECLRTHLSLNTLFNAGLADIAMGNFQEAMQSTSLLIESAKKSHHEEVLTVEHYQNLGLSCLECMRYAEAVEALTEAIDIHPSKKEPHFLRAVAYFEMGNFENAIKDFLEYEKDKAPPPPLIPSIEFITGLTKGIKNGAQEAAIDFVPTLCQSVYGMSKCLWSFTQTPVESSVNFFNACCEAEEYFEQVFKEFDQEMIEDFAIDINKVMLPFDKLDENIKGEIIGHYIGRFGLDILGGVGAMKGIAALKKLKDANRLCNIEAISLSNVDKEIIIAEALKHSHERDLFFKNVKYNFDAHSKHVIGHNNYIEGNSIWQHSHPEELLKRFSGSGIPRRGAPGVPGYKESVDFQEIIGVWISEDASVTLPTSRGTIHYGKKGAHIVPSNPNPM